MRKPEVSEEEIIEAGLRLVANGQTVTGSALRRQVGDRGNVKRLADVWSAYHADAVRGVVALQIPDEILQHVDPAVAHLRSEILSLVGRSHAIAVAEANKKAEEAATQATKAWAALDQQFADAASLIEELEQA